MPPGLGTSREDGHYKNQSYFADTFKSPDDQSFVESCARIIAKFMEERSNEA